MRCFALAQAWQERGGNAVFLGRIDAPAIRERITSEGFEVHEVTSHDGGLDDAAGAARAAQEAGAEWVVVDGYHFGADYQRALKEDGLKVLFIDDNSHATAYFADIVLNQNPYADESMYANRAPETRLLLGTRYVLLRSEFRAWREWRREIPDVARKVLVTMGGADPENVTLKVIEALGQVEVDGLEAVAIAGASNPHYDCLVEAAAASPADVRVDRSVTDMPALMAWADVAVSAAGTTAYELAFMGTPMVLMAIAGNQRGVAARFRPRRIALCCDTVEDGPRSDQTATALGELAGSASMRRSMSESGRGLVDGNGGRRVVLAAAPPELRLRSVDEANCELLWGWANEPAAREASFTPGPIPWEQHVAWFTSKMGDANCMMSLALDAHEHPVGVVRCDVDGDDAVISISIAAERRGKGLGTSAIRLACRNVFR
ncbi:MAG: UDP-2,4-diacetamido-2,4,6-trideoxy-beta-L-altropyranose hydrolase, partial [Planctomycetota bacterium]